MRKIIMWIDNKIENSPKSKIIWRERDGEQYTAFWIDKWLYAFKYHRTAIETTITIISSIAGAILGCIIAARF